MYRPRKLSRNDEDALLQAYRSGEFTLRSLAISTGMASYETVRTAIQRAARRRGMSRQELFAGRRGPQNPGTQENPVRALRMKLGLNQHEFADLIGVRHFTTVSCWERGRNKPRRIFQRKLDELARGVTPPERKAPAPAKSATAPSATPSYVESLTHDQRMRDALTAYILLSGVSVDRLGNDLHIDPVDLEDMVEETSKLRLAMKLLRA